MGMSRNLEQALAEAQARYKAMTPEQKAAMWKAQRESFARGMNTPCEHGELDFEQCPDCRGWNLP
jgi:hypothetical protein